MNWTLTYDGETKTFAEWGLSLPVISLRTWDASVCAFQHATAYDGAPLFAFREAGIVKLGDDIVFQGKFGQAERLGEGIHERIQYALKDALWELSRLPFQIEYGTWAGANRDSGMLTVFSSGGAAQFISAQLEQVVSFAAAHGVSVQFGTAANLDIQPLPLDMRDASCLDVMRVCRKWMPDIQTVLDHSTTPPTLSFVRRGDAEAVSWGTEEICSAVRITELHELQVTQVVLRYLSRGSVDGEPVTNITVDVYPPGSDGKTDAAIIQSFDLQGPVTVHQEQVLETENISPNSRAWWTKRLAWLHEATGDDFVIEDGGRFVNTDEGLEADTSGLVNEIIGGAVPSWESGAQGAVTVQAVAKKFYYDGNFYEEQKLSWNGQATALAGGLYKSAPETTFGEYVPTGLAHAYYNATHPLHYAGSVTRRYAELPASLPRPGDVLNLTGGEAVTRGWNAMRGCIQEVEVDVQRAAVSLTFGAPEHLGPQDLVELARMRSGLTEGSRIEQAESGAQRGASAVSGARRTAGSNSEPVPTTPVVRGHLSITRVANGEFLVSAGVCNGQAVKAGSVSGAAIDEDGYAVSRTSGVIYIGFKWEVVYTHGFLTMDVSDPPACFVASANSEGAISAEPEDGEFYYILGTITGGELTADNSINGDLWADIRDANAAGGNKAAQALAKL